MTTTVPHGASTGPQTPEAAQLETVLFEIKKVIVGQDRVIERLLVCLARPGPLPARGRARPGQDPGHRDAGRGRSADRSPGCSSPPTCCPPTSSAPASTGRRSETFDVELGPVFANFVLADEINRAPAKVQSALLEVMAERHVSIGGETFPAPDPFLVLATQNPIESEGVYPLPEAQRDRFLMKVRRRLPLARRGGGDRPPHGRVAAGRPGGARPRRPARACSRRPTGSTSTGPSSTTPSASCSPPVSPATYGLADLDELIAYGASPRASLGLVAGGRALALLRGRTLRAAPGRLRRRPRGPAPPARALLRGAGPRPRPPTTSSPGSSAPSPRPAIAPSQDLRRRTDDVEWRDPLGDSIAPPRLIRTSTAEVLRRLELLVTRRLDGLLQGDYQGLVPGHGSEPGEAREYQPGDDVRRIDWNVTARMQRTARPRDDRRPRARDLGAGRPVGQPRLRHGRLREARPRPRRRRRRRVPHRPRRQPPRRGHPRRGRPGSGHARPPGPGARS